MLVKKLGHFQQIELWITVKLFLRNFKDRGGVVTTLSGAEKAKFDKLMKDKVMPAMAKMIDADALKAAQEYAKNN